MPWTALINALGSIAPTVILRYLGPVTLDLRYWSEPVWMRSAFAPNRVGIVSVAWTLLATRSTSTSANVPVRSIDDASPMFRMSSLAEPETSTWMWADFSVDRDAIDWFRISVGLRLGPGPGPQALAVSATSAASAAR